MKKLMIIGLFIVSALSFSSGIALGNSGITINSSKQSEIGKTVGDTQDQINNIKNKPDDMKSKLQINKTDKDKILKKNQTPSFKREMEKKYGVSWLEIETAAKLMK